jgi:hypothetical protein
MAGTRRGFGQTERRKNSKTGKTSGWRARYEGPDGFRYSFTFTTKADVEAFLRGEEALIARGAWVPAKARAAAFLSDAQVSAVAWLTTVMDAFLRAAITTRYRVATS